jgi:hypothetical protein
MVGVVVQHGAGAGQQVAKAAEEEPIDEGRPEGGREAGEVFLRGPRPLVERAERGRPERGQRGEIEHVVGVHQGGQQRAALQVDSLRHRLRIPPLLHVDILGGDQPPSARHRARRAGGHRGFMCEAAAGGPSAGSRRLDRERSVEPEAQAHSHERQEAKEVFGDARAPGPRQREGQRASRCRRSDHGPPRQAPSPADRVSVRQGT